MQYPQYLTFIVIACCVLSTLGGCSNEDETAGIGGPDSSNRTPLTIHATTTPFEGLPPDDPSQTRTVDNGNTTTFSTGDALGLFAIKDGAIIDDISNTKLIYSQGTGGSAGSWNPLAGTTLYWSEGVEYVAYSPYQDGITIGSTKTTKDIISRLASYFTAESDQSTRERYAASDLLTAIGTPTTDAANPARKILTLNFKHQYALMILEPQVYAEVVAPAGAGFVYFDGCMAPVPLRADETDAGYFDFPACPMSDGTYRYIMPINANKPENVKIYKGGYRVVEGSLNIEWTGDVTFKMTPGHSYTLKMPHRPSGTIKTVERPLAPGDIYLEDFGEIVIVPGNGPISDDGIIEPNTGMNAGIVVTCDPARMTDPKCIANGWTHAYVMAIFPGSDGAWLDAAVGTGSDESVLDNTTTRYLAEHNMNGYSETEAMLTERTKYGDIDNYPILKDLISYRTYHPLPSKINCSPWFIPSIGQWIDVINNIGGVSPDRFSMIGDSSWEEHKEIGYDVVGKINTQWSKAGYSITDIREQKYWCSSEMSGTQNWAVEMYYRKGDEAGITIKGFEKNDNTRSYYIPFFAF